MFGEIRVLFSHSEGSNYYHVLALVSASVRSSLRFCSYVISSDLNVPRYYLLTSVGDMYHE